MGIYWIALGTLFIVSAVLILLASAVTVESGTVGLVFRWKKFRRVLEPGLNFIIPLLDSVEIYSVATHQIELPEEPEKVDRENDLLATGMKHPFRVGHKGMDEADYYVKVRDDLPDTDRNAYEIRKLAGLPKQDGLIEAMKKDAYHAALTGEYAVVVEWHLKSTDETSIRNFIQNVSPESGRGREQEVKKRMEDEVSRVLQEYLVPVTFGHATERIALFSAIIRNRLEILIGEKQPDKADDQKTDRPSWGIQLGDVYIKQPHAGKTVNKARNEASAAASKREEDIRQAEADKQKAILKAEGDKFAAERAAEAAKYAEVQKGEGEAGRIRAMAEAMADPNAKFIAELDVKERGMEALEKSKITTYAPGKDTLLTLDNK